MFNKHFAAKAAASAMSMAMILGTCAPAMAAYTYTPVAGTSTTFEKFLIMDEGDNVPNATFAFTVAPGQARSADTSDNAVMQVLPGVGTPTIQSVTFAPGDATKLASAAGTDIDVQRPASARANGLTAANGVELEAGEKYAQKTATVSFAGITFDEPGIYRYVITETANADHEAAGIMHDNDVDRILDVYVTDNGSGTLEVSAYVLHTNDSDVVINNTMGSADVAEQAAALADKTDGFTNEYNSKDLVFKKEVTGNQASRDKYFEFTAKLSNVADADVFTVSLADDNNAATTDGFADATSGNNSATRLSNQGKTNPTEVTGAQLKAGVKFYLQHGQSIAIRGIAPNAGYEITEDAEDYKSTASIVAGHEDLTATNSDSQSAATIGQIADSATVANSKAAMTSFQNQRDGIVPTGLIVMVAPYAVGAALAIGGGAILLRKKEED